MKTKKILIFLFILLTFSFIIAQEEVKLPEMNDLYIGKKIKNYLPHMSWSEFEAAVKNTDMIIVPLGSIEQHGHHLPLGTDFIYANEAAKLIAQYTDVIVAPVLMGGISAHHMGFPGTITISPETFQKVIFESCECLIKHGIRKIMFLNGHGGNAVAMQNLIHQINHETPATAINIGAVRPEDDKRMPVEIDYHGGVNETSWMLYLANRLVDMKKAVNPVLSFPEDAKKAYDEAKKGNKDLNLVYDANIFLSEKSGKKATTRDLTNTGIVTSGNLKDANVELGRRQWQARIQAAVRFINDWKKLK